METKHYPDFSQGKTAFLKDCLIRAQTEKDDLSGNDLKYLQRQVTLVRLQLDPLQNKRVDKEVECYLDFLKNG